MSSSECYSFKIFGTVITQCLERRKTHSQMMEIFSSVKACCLFLKLDETSGKNSFRRFDTKQRTEMIKKTKNNNKKIIIYIERRIREWCTINCCSIIRHRQIMAIRVVRRINITLCYCDELMREQKKTSHIQQFILWCRSRRYTDAVLSIWVAIAWFMNVLAFHLYT